MNPPSSNPIPAAQERPSPRHTELGDPARGRWMPRFTLPPGRLLLWSDRSFVAFLGLGFVIAPEPSWAFWFYALVMPFGAWFLYQGWRPDWRDGRLALLLGLILWSTLTIAWADQPQPPVSKQILWAFNGLCTAAFLLTLTMVAEQSTRMRDRMVTVIVCCATGNALFSVVRFVSRQGGWDRLEGWGETRNAILGAFIIGVCSILALGRSLRRERFWPLWLVPIPLFLAFTVMTDSRGPLIAVVLSALLVLPRWSRRTYLLGLAALIAAAVGTVTLAPDLVHAAFERLAQRGTSYRLDIWHASIEAILQRPIIGHGMTATVQMKGDFGHHPHDLYLSALFYSGAVGLLLLLGGLGWIFRDVLRTPVSAERQTCLALLVHLVLSGATDLSQITKGPGELWYIVWLPLGYALGYLRDPALSAQRRERINPNACATVAARTAPRSPGNT